MKKYKFKCLVYIHMILNMDLKNKFQDYAIKKIYNVDTKNSYSFSDEEKIINDILFNKMSIDDGFCVDVGANDGINFSNTYALYQKGWSGLSIEYDSKCFSKLAYALNECQNSLIAKCKVTPDNVVSLFDAYSVPKCFEFLSLDIDSYDFFVLDALLSSYRPKLICAEINEKIPVPIKFTVKYNPEHWWKGDHFYGQSISQVYELCLKYNYSIIHLEYNNIFLVPSEFDMFTSMTPEEAYKLGYVDKIDRKQKMPWNSDMESLLTMEPEEAVKFINNYFEHYIGKFTLSI